MAKPTTQKRRRRAIGLLLFGALVVAAAVAWHKLGPYHFKTVEPGVLYRGGQQETYNLALLTGRYGFKTIVSLREPEERGSFPDWYEPEREFCKERGIRFYNIPLHGKEPPSPEQVRQWLAIMQDERNHPVFVHCAEGVVRTGALVALYRIALQHKDNRAAWEGLPHFGHDFADASMQPLQQFVLRFEPSGVDLAARPPRPAENAGGGRLR